MRKKQQQIAPEADVTMIAVSDPSNDVHGSKAGGWRILRHLLPQKIRSKLQALRECQQLNSELEAFRDEFILEREQMRSEFKALRDELIREWTTNFVEYKIGSVTLKLPSAHQLPNYQRDYLYYDRFLPFLTKYIDKYSVILDVGANVGDTIAGIIQSCSNKIIAIEGHPVFYDILCKNITTFSCADRIVSHRALAGTGKYNGTLVDNGSTASLILDGKENIINLDEIILSLKQSIESIGLIIIDTDGYDGDVINSVNGIVKASKPIIFWENYFKTTDQYNDLQEAYRLLVASDYEYFTIFDNFGVPLIVNGNIDALLNFNKYISMTQRSSIVRPSIYYTDVCATTYRYKDIVVNAIEDCYGSFSPTSI